MTASYEAAYQKGCTDTFKTFYEIRSHRDELLKAIELLEKERAAYFNLIEWLKRNKRSVLYSMSQREMDELSDLVHSFKIA